MPTDSVCSLLAYAGEIKAAFWHFITSGDECGGSGFAEKIAGGDGFNRDELAHVVKLERGL
jgi:hypothetical protein